MELGPEWLATSLDHRFERSFVFVRLSRCWQLIINKRGDEATLLYFFLFPFSSIVSINLM